MNIDVIAIVLLVALLTAFFAFWWSVIRGHSSNRWWVAGRLIISFVVALVLVLWGAYWLMDSRTVQVMGDHVSRVDTARKVVALTFDDGPNDMYVAELVGDLGQYGAHGTFYVIGT